MKFLIINELGQSVIKESEILPRIGDKICCFYSPWPTVIAILLWPNEGVLNKINEAGKGIEAIITVQ